MRQRFPSYNSPLERIQFPADDGDEYLEYLANAPFARAARCIQAWVNELGTGGYRRPLDLRHDITQAWRDNKVPDLLVARGQTQTSAGDLDSRLATNPALRLLWHTAEVVRKLSVGDSGASGMTRQQGRGVEDRLKEGLPLLRRTIDEAVKDEAVKPDWQACWPSISDLQFEPPLDDIAPLFIVPDRHVPEGHVEASLQALEALAMYLQSTWAQVSVRPVLTELPTRRRELVVHSMCFPRVGAELLEFHAAKWTDEAWGALSRNERYAIAYPSAYWMPVQSGLTGGFRETVAAAFREACKAPDADMWPVAWWVSRPEWDRYQNNEAPEGFDNLGEISCGGGSVGAAAYLCFRAALTDTAIRGDRSVTGGAPSNGLFTKVSGTEEKEARTYTANPSMRRAFEFKSAVGEPVKKMWAEVSVRTDAARAWCDAMEAFLTGPSPWVLNPDAERRFQPRTETAKSLEQIQQEQHGQEPGRPSAAAPGNWRTSPVVAVVGHGGLGKSWWLQHQLGDADGQGEFGLQRARKLLEIGVDPTDVGLPVWVDQTNVESISAYVRSRTHDAEATADRLRKAISGLLDALGERVVKTIPNNLTKPVRDLLGELVTERRGHLILDGAENFSASTAAHFVRDKIEMSSRGERNWTVWVTSRNVDVIEAYLGDDVPKEHQRGITTVEIKPLTSTGVEELFKSVASQVGPAGNDQVLERVASTPMIGEFPLIVTVAAHLDNHAVNALQQGPGPLLYEGIQRLFARKDEKPWRAANLPDDLRGRDSIMPDRILRALGAQYLRSVQQNRHNDNAATTGFQLSDIREWDTPTIDKVAGYYTSAGILKAINRRGETRWLFGNDVIRELCIAAAIAEHEEMAQALEEVEHGTEDSAPIEPCKACGDGTKPDDPVRCRNLLHALRDYLNIMVDSVPHTMMFTGNLLNPEEHITNSDKKRDRLARLVIDLARPTPLPQLPRTVQPLFMHDSGST